MVQGFKAILESIYVTITLQPSLLTGNNLLESAMSMLNVENYFKRIVRVRLGDELGIDTGGLSR